MTFEQPGNMDKTFEQPADMTFGYVFKATCSTRPWATASTRAWKGGHAPEQLADMTVGYLFN